MKIFHQKQQKEQKAYFLLVSHYTSGIRFNGRDKGLRSRVQICVEKYHLGLHKIRFNTQDSNSNSNHSNIIFNGAKSIYMKMANNFRIRKRTADVSHFAASCVVSKCRNRELGQQYPHPIRLLDMSCQLFATNTLLSCP